MLLLPLVVPLVVGSTAPAPATPPPTQDPTTQQPLPVDPTTGQPLKIDPDTGQLIIPRDPTTGLPIPLVDATGQPLILRDESGQPLPEDTLLVPPDSLLRAEAHGVGSFDPSDPTSRGAATGGTRYRARLAVVEGFTTNALETQALANGPYVTHPALFTGLDGSIDLLTWTGEADAQNLRIGGRIQHYIPVDGYTQIDGGTLNASWNGTFSLGKRTFVSAHVIGTFTSANSAVLADGPLYQIDPSDLTHVYTIENARVALVQELSRSWRVTVGAESWLGTTISEAPIALPSGGLLYHSGLDYVTPGGDIALSHDFGPADIGTLILHDSESFSAFVIDYSKNPPTYNGTAWNQAATLTANWTHAFDEHLRTVLGAGGSLAQAPPLDADQQAILSPVGSALIVYTRRYWLATAGGSYSYGSANPRVGYGPSAGGSFTLQGLPFPNGRWSRLSILANGSGSQSTFAQGGGASTALIQAGGGLEGRYGLNRWLGVSGGYNLSYIELQGAGSLAPTLRNVFFLGLAGYFANDGSLPTLEQFAVGITPPG